jgi:predicted nucleotide-binding protein (sugar kinase/HSP70/actin superfamily)
LHYYTKLPQILEPEKKYSKVDIVKEIITKIKQTPINELPKKIIKKLKRG